MPRVYELDTIGRDGRVTRVPDSNHLSQMLRELSTGSLRGIVPLPWHLVPYPYRERMEELIQKSIRGARSRK